MKTGKLFYKPSVILILTLHYNLILVKKSQLLGIKTHYSLCRHPAAAAAAKTSLRMYLFFYKKKYSVCG